MYFVGSLVSDVGTQVPNNLLYRSIYFYFFAKAVIYSYVSDVSTVQERGYTFWFMLTLDLSPAQIWWKLEEFCILQK